MILRVIYRGCFLSAYCQYRFPTLTPITWGCHIGDGSFSDVGHESHNGEDDKAGKHAGEGVYAADNDRISVWERQSKRQPLSRWYQFLINQSHIVVFGGRRHFVCCSSTEAVQNCVDSFSGDGKDVVKIAGFRNKSGWAVHRLNQHLIQSK